MYMSIHVSPVSDSGVCGGGRGCGVSAVSDSGVCGGEGCGGGMWCVSCVPLLPPSHKAFHVCRLLASCDSISCLLDSIMEVVR